ncbi:MAG: Tripartite ATP-independent periplasmic transporter DctQ component [uncultured Thiotrichaceae bacterium]|uniref:TRAP transporter small permease protein n=1 Tax=uncultured Thiotrichaceae bacterium TaxID=298394 RepID=A0A6S6SD92_9GAMM|nr:MAG: Tripartite ATP-independent periplasmic transporter DctQ component [uncultured Thiotrichaceae bacterium]
MVNIIHKLEENIIALLLVAMTLLVFFETILRFFFGTGLIWAEELTLHLSAWLVLFGASYGLRVGAHIGVDFLVKKLPDATQRIVTSIMLSMALVYCGLFIYGAWVYLSKMHQIDIPMEDIEIPLWIAHSILLIGFVLFAIRLLEIGYRVIKGEQTRLKIHDEAEESLHLKEELESTPLGGSAK